MYGCLMVGGHSALREIMGRRSSGLSTLVWVNTGLVGRADALRLWVLALLVDGCFLNQSVDNFYMKRTGLERECNEG